MGFFSKLFGKRDYSEGILQEGFALAAEMERVYRNQLGSIHPTGVGLYKARLLSASFVLAAYKIGECAEDEGDLLQFVNQCSGVAFFPFAQPGASPSFSKNEAASFSAEFMNFVFKLIALEITEGPSELNRKTAAFHQLMEFCHSCLAESVGAERYKSEKPQRDLEVESIIWSHLRWLGDLLDRIKGK